MNCDELEEMNEDELRKLLSRYGCIEDTSNFDKQDLLDLIVDEY
jgi:hypothetical protein